MYTKNLGRDILIIGVYVDDTLVTGSNLAGIKEFKEKVAKKLDMSDLEKLTYYLGIELSKETDIYSRDNRSMQRKLLIKLGCWTAIRPRFQCISRSLSTKTRDACQLILRNLRA